MNRHLLATFILACHVAVAVVAGFEDIVNGVVNAADDVKDHVEAVRSKMSTSRGVQAVSSNLEGAVESLRNQNEKFSEDVAALRNQSAELKEDVAKTSKLMCLLQAFVTPGKNVVVFLSFD